MYHILKALITPYHPQVVGHVLVDRTASVGPNCQLGPDVTIGPGVVVEEGVCLSRTTLLKGVRVGRFSWIDSSILGWGARIGRLYYYCFCS